MDDAIHGDAGENPAGDEAASAAAGHADLLAQLKQLEDFAARTVGEGESLPPQATEMILHLREIVEALDGLSASMAAPPPSDASPSQHTVQDDETRGAS
ncbi:MAG: hypothetical protein ACJ79A_00735 [Gemmatimonadaceae bacterium]